MSGSNAGYAGSGPSHGKRSPVPNTSAAGIDLRTTTRKGGGGTRKIKDEGSRSLGCRFGGLARLRGGRCWWWWCYVWDAGCSKLKATGDN